MVWSTGFTPDALPVATPPLYPGLGTGTPWRGWQELDAVLRHTQDGCSFTLGPILGTKIKERRFRFLGHVLRESAGKELRDMLKTEMTQKCKIRGRKRMKWHDIGNSVTEIRKFEELTKSAEDRENWKKYLKVANLHL